MKVLTSFVQICLMYLKCDCRTTIENLFIQTYYIRITKNKLDQINYSGKYNKIPYTIMNNFDSIKLNTFYRVPSSYVKLLLPNENKGFQIKL